MPAPERRRAVLILMGGAMLAAAALAWPWVRLQVVAPIALGVWLLLRVLVLSIHQAVYWTVLVLAAPVLLFVMLRRRYRSAPQPLPWARPVRAHPVESWRWLVSQTADGVRPAPTMGWNEFVQLVVSLCALQRRVPADYVLHDAMRAGRVPLPPEVHAFLFPSPPTPPGGRLVRLAWRLRRSARRALRRLSGRERAERLHSMSRLLSFLEDSLEMTPHDHPDRARR